MNNLQVIENELVPVYETSTGEKVVYGSELHNVLEVKSRFNDWIGNRLSDCDAVENEDYDTFTKNLVKGRPQTEYIIKLDTAKEMAMLERNDKGKDVRRYFITVEKKYKEVAINKQKLPPHLQVLQGLLDQIAEHELRLNKAQETSQQAKEVSQQALDKVESIKEVVGASITNWRKDTSNLINKMAIACGGYENIKSLREESYKALEQRFGVQLSVRLTNKRRRMADEGVCKSKRDKLTKIDVIADDKKLIEGYVAIVKEMAIKYGVDNRE